MMSGIHLLLFAACVVLVRCQQKPQVSMSPELKEVFLGDLFYLTCNDNMSGKKVKWYLDSVEQNVTTKTWKIALAGQRHSGSYRCESNGQRSDRFEIEVLEYIPQASLMIKVGLAVIQKEIPPILQLSRDDGLLGWSCRIFNGKEPKFIALAIENNEVSLDFHLEELQDPENVLWCVGKDEHDRSNQIILRTTEKRVSLQMYPHTAVDGNSLTLQCRVFHVEQIERTVFYKGNQVLVAHDSLSYTIPNVTESDVGSYKCMATFRFKDGPLRNAFSDPQDLLVQARPVSAEMQCANILSCSCPRCLKGVSYHWYRVDEASQPIALRVWNIGLLIPQEDGTYVCRAVSDTGRSSLSNSCVHKSNHTGVVATVVVLLILVGLVPVAVVLYRRCKRRNTTGPIYEDVALRAKGDDSYEPMLRGTQREAEYDTLHPGASGTPRREGEYEPLKKEEMKDALYHTLGAEGAAGGAGAYEALKREGMKDAVYHTLAAEGAAGGAGAYEALKKEGMKDAVYHTLRVEDADGGEREQAVGKDK